MQAPTQDQENTVQPLAMGAAFLSGFVEELTKLNAEEEASNSETRNTDELDLDPPCCIDWTKRW